MPFGWGIVSTGKHPDIKIAPAMAAADGGLSPGDRFEIAVFAINGPISAAPGNFLFFREAKVEFFR